MAGSVQAPSLRTRVLRHVMLPLALTWLLGTLVALAVAHLFTQQAFDRSLLDDAFLLATHVDADGGRVELALSPRELRTVLFDQNETIFFAVRRPDGSLLAGSEDLRAEPPEPGSLYQFSDRPYRGRTLRFVVLRRDQPVPFLVVMAQTTQARSALLERLLAYSILPQIVLLVLLALWLRRSVGGDLTPLAALQQAVDRRHASDLSPVPEVAGTREIGRLVAALNALLARLARSAQAQREFAGNVAHELRTPLAGIRALAEYGLAQKDPAAWRGQLERIAGSEARASRLVDQLLALARADEASTGIRLETLALDELVSDAVLRFLPRADALGADLGARGIEQPVSVRGDAMLVEGILNNLIDNALRYGRAADGQPSSVTVEVAQQGGAVRMSVIDGGPGLTAGQRAGLLARWAQGEPGLLLGQGSGLGLAIVARYAELMQARLELGAGPDGRGLAAGVVFAPGGGPAPQPAAAIG